MSILKHTVEYRVIWNALPTVVETSKQQKIKCICFLLSIPLFVSLDYLAFQEAAEQFQPLIKFFATFEKSVSIMSPLQTRWSLCSYRNYNFFESKIKQELHISLVSRLYLDRMFFTLCRIIYVQNSRSQEMTWAEFS